MSGPDDEIPDDAPEGMVRRTRKVRKRRKGGKTKEEGKAHADSLFAKAKDLLVGMEEEEVEMGHVDVAEQVRRLQKGKEEEKVLDDVWGTKRKSTSWLWIILAGMIVSVVAIIIGVTKWLSDDPRQEIDLSGMGSSVGTVGEVDLSQGPLGWFHDNSLQVLAEVEEIIAQANAATDAETIAKLVRDSPSRSEGDLDPALWGSDCLTNPTSGFSWQPKLIRSSEGAGAYTRGVLKVNGRRIDGEPYEAYFVHINDKLLLDWDASLGLSQMSVAQVAEKKPRNEVLLRCRISKKTSYDQEFGKVTYSGYVISGEASDQFFLAYVPLEAERGKIIDRDLRLLLNYGSFVTDRPPFQNKKVTVRVRYNPQVGSEGVFEIVEFLHNGWASP